MNTLVTLLVFALCGMVVARCVMCETAVLMLTPGRAHRLVESDAKGARALDELIEVRHRMRAMTQFISALYYAALAVALVFIITDSPSMGPWDGVLGVVLGELAAVMLAFILFQALPRAFAVSNPEELALCSAGFALRMTRIFGPLTSLLSAPAEAVIGAAGGERRTTIWAVTPDERADDEEDEEAEEEAETLLGNITEFADKIAREVMTPRTDMNALEDTATLADAVALIEQTGVSRIPLYHETMDDIRGVLYSKDLLRAIARAEARDGAPATLLDLARPAVFVPETKPVRELMAAMRTHTHLVIVTDEYGGTSGLVTLEDLLEEIVGDISDEFDSESPLCTPLKDGGYLLDGRMSIDELNDLFDTDFDLDADSVGGLFTEIAGHIPVKGESVEAEGITFTVTRVDAQRIEQLRAVAPQRRVEEPTDDNR